MKKIFFVIIAIVSILLISPYFVGKGVETKYQTIIQQVQQNQQISIENSTFERNWFTAKAVNTLVIPLRTNPALNADFPDKITLTISENINFGPMILSELGIEFGLARSIATIDVQPGLLNNELAEQVHKNLHIQSFVNFTSDYITDINFAGIDTQVDDAQVIVFPLTAKYIVENERHILANIDWQGLKTINKKMEFTLGSTKAQLDEQLVAGDLYSNTALFNGDVNFVINKMHAQGVDRKEIFLLNNFTLTGGSKVTDNLMNILFTYHIDELNLPFQKFHQANLALTMNRLDVDVLQTFNKILAASTSSPDKLFTDNSKQLLSVLAKLLKQDPSFAITDMSVETTSGKIQSQLQLTVDKKRFDAKNAASFMAAANVNAQGSAPVEFFKKMGMMPMVDQYIQQGFILRNNDELNFKMNFTQGKLQLNDKVLPL